MKPIQMVDLVSQYQNIKSEVDEAVLNVFEKAAFINGPDVKELEKELSEFLGAKHVFGCGNGTDALQIAMMALDLPKGSEIIAPDFTFVATVEVAKLLGYEPVLIDVDPKTFNLDIEQLEENINENTAAILPVHLFGQCANMDAIMEIAEKHNLFVIEDTAQALGSNYHHKNGNSSKAGTIGHIGTTSFFPSKNLGGFGDGGALFTDDDKLAEKIKVIRNHGMSNQYNYVRAGVNSRLDTVQAAILRVKLRHLDEYNAARQEAARKYNEAFADLNSVETPEKAEYTDHIYHQYTLKLPANQRDNVKKHLDEKGIPNKVYYPDGLHEHEVYANGKRGKKGLPVSRMLKDSVLSLPMHTELEDEQIEFITQSVKEAIKH